MKTHIPVFLIIMVWVSSLIAQPQITSEKRVYKNIGGRELHVDIFYSNSDGSENKKPAIAFFHGGGWVFGDPSEFYGACKRFAIKGFVTFSFQYRLSINEDGTYPHPEITVIESVKDARSAIRWLREQAQSLNIDPEKIVVGGQSAGGQLAWSTVLFDDINESTDNLNISPRPNALLLYSSNYNAMEAWIDMILNEKRDQIWSISPYHNLKSGLPPALAFYGQNDCTVLPYTVQIFAEKMRELKNPFELIMLEGRDHYLGEGNEKYARYFDEGILERTDQFLMEIHIMP